MEVRKLYYEDSHLRSFEAAVTGCTPVKGGYAVTLDATAFYPEGGGQACDLGTLADASVLSVREAEGDVIHLCDRPLSVGSTVTGRIDWERRFHLMQQHSGEHMVSGVVHSLYGYHNVGFHMGSDVVTIDFDGPIPQEDLPKIEAQVNAAIWQNLPLRCWYPAPEELPTVNYRRKKDLPWPVRIVEIPGIDLCACCGTQVKRTGEIGLVKLFSCVKFHQGVRIEMACGRRAFELLNTAFDQNRQVSQAFSAKIMETGDAARRMNARLAESEFRATGLEKRLFDAIAAGYAGVGRVVHFEDGLSPAAVRELADRIAQHCGGTAAVFSPMDGGHALCLVDKTGDVKALGDSLTQTLGGRGGGKKGFFQGSVKATQPQVRQFFAENGNH